MTECCRFSCQSRGCGVGRSHCMQGQVSKIVRVYHTTEYHLDVWRSYGSLQCPFVRDGRFLRDRASCEENDQSTILKILQQDLLASHILIICGYNATNITPSTSPLALPSPLRTALDPRSPRVPDTAAYSSHTHPTPLASLQTSRRTLANRARTSGPSSSSPPSSVVPLLLSSPP